MSTTPSSLSPVRGCGTRVRGGLYMEVKLSSGGGVPFDFFLLDPPLLLDFQRLGVTSVGTKVIERHDCAHVVDMVGATHYPNVADFIEEGRRFGISRRISRTTDLSALSVHSRLLLAHSRAFIENFADYTPDWRFAKGQSSERPFPRCPKGIGAHEAETPPPFCIGVYWQDIDGNSPDGVRPTFRELPSFSYRAFFRPEGLIPRYKPAVFASFPIHRIVAVRDNAKVDSENAKILSAASLPTAFVDA